MADIKRAPSSFARMEPFGSVLIETTRGCLKIGDVPSGEAFPAAGK